MSCRSLDSCPDSTGTLDSDHPEQLDPASAARGASADDPLGLCDSVIEGKYRIGSLVGQGGHSYVYRAEHLTLAAPVAIKFLKPDSLRSEDDGSRSESFLEEGRLLFRACSFHPAVVQLKDCGSACTQRGAVPYLVMEWLDGRTLADELRGREPSEHNRSLHEALAKFAPVADCLGVLHARGITHRDIKPGNLIEVPGNVATPLKLADFGIAKWTHPDEPGASSSGLNLTPQFAAPEQWSRRLGKTGPWTDVYSFALCVMHWMAGHKSELATWDHVTTTLDPGHRPTPRHFGLELPTPVERVFERAVSLSPQDRYPTLTEFWAALTAAAGPRGEPRRSVPPTLLIAATLAAIATTLLVVGACAVGSRLQRSDTASAPQASTAPLDAPPASTALAPSQPSPSEPAPVPLRQESRPTQASESWRRSASPTASTPSPPPGASASLSPGSPPPPAPSDILRSRTGPL